MNAGYSEAWITDASLGIQFPLTVLYPTDETERETRIGPYTLETAEGAEPSSGPFPLVMISHGSGGSPLVYRTLSRYLAKSGFIVGMPEHPFDNRNDHRWKGTVQNLEYRPRHIRLAVDWVFEQERFRRCATHDAVTLIGHSMGGYTALAAAGGMPVSFPHESPDGQSRTIEVVPDRRVKSLVLLAPATVWFQGDEALRAVDLPILMLDAEKDPYTPPFHAQIVLKGVADPTKLIYRTVENAGHFSFLSPFPDPMINPSFLPSQDPPGFDRKQFNERLCEEILQFLLTT